MKLNEGISDRDYSIIEVNTEEDGMKEFLFTLGCYPGESISIISQIASNLIICIKDARYSIDENLASAIHVKDASVEDLLESKPKAI